MRGLWNDLVREVRALPETTKIYDGQSLLLEVAHVDLESGLYGLDAWRMPRETGERPAYANVSFQPFCNPWVEMRGSKWRDGSSTRPEDVLPGRGTPVGDDGLFELSPEGARILLDALRGNSRA